MTDTTDQVLVDMLTENTGRHLLDSGGAYGRNWERNQGLTVEAALEREPITVNVYNGEIDYFTVDVFHFLRERIEYAADLDAELHTFADQEEWEREPWMAVVDAWCESLEDTGREIEYGVYGQGARDGMWVNTYNGEDLLSQVLQYAICGIDGDNVYILQIHGGCDVRGGYTAPRVFYDSGEYSLLDNARLYASTQEPEPTQNRLLDVGPQLNKDWMTDDAGYTWYEDGTWPSEPPEWEWDEDRNAVIYTPWNTEVHFSSC